MSRSTPNAAVPPIIEYTTSSRWAEFDSLLREAVICWGPLGSEHPEHQPIRHHSVQHPSEFKLSQSMLQCTTQEILKQDTW